MKRRIQSAFDAVHAEETLKRRTQAYLAKRIAAGTARSGRRLAAVCACLLLAALGFGGYRLYFTPVCAISLDVNPSLELGVNRFDRVVSVEGFNEEGKRIAAAAAIQSLDYSAALDVLLASDVLRPYLENGGLVSITVIGNTDEKSEEMRARIAGSGYGAAANIQCQCGNRDEVAAAHAAGLSFGKYQAFLALRAWDPSITAEDVRGLTMRQIRDWLAELSAPSDGAPHGNGGPGHGRGRPFHGGRDD